MVDSVRSLSASPAIALCQILLGDLNSVHRVRLSRADSPLRSRRSAGKPLNASREEVDSSPESYRTRVEEAKALNTTKQSSKLYLAKKQKTEEVDEAVDRPPAPEGATWISYRTPKDPIPSLTDPRDFPPLVKTN